MTDRQTDMHNRHDRHDRQACTIGMTDMTDRQTCTIGMTDMTDTHDMHECKAAHKRLHQQLIALSISTSHIHEPIRTKKNAVRCTRKSTRVIHAI
jgi:hypothetical protein